MLTHEEITDEHIEQVLDKIISTSDKTKFISILNDNGLSAQLFADKAMETIFQQKRLSIVKQLIDCGVRFSSVVLDIWVYTLDSSSRRQILELLLKQKEVNVSYCNNEILQLACENKQPSLVKALLSRKEIDPSFDDDICLITACSRGYGIHCFNTQDEILAIEIVKLLLSHEKVDPSAQNNAPLITACESGFLQVVKLLLSDKRVNPAARRCDALVSWGGLKGKEQEFMELILSRPEIFPRGNGKAIIRACERNYANVVQAILAKKNVDVSTGNYQAIKTALQGGDKTAEICLLLLDREEVDLSANDNEFFRLACKYKCQKVIEFLLENPKTDKKKLNIITKAIMLCK